MPWSPFQAGPYTFTCAYVRGEVFTFEDLVFTTAEKTALNFFPGDSNSSTCCQFLGPNHWGDAGSGDGGNDVRGMAAVLSSDLAQCWGPSLGAGALPGALTGLGEQSGGFSG